MAKPMKTRDFRRALSMLGCTFHQGGKHTVVHLGSMQVGSFAGRHDETSDGMVQMFERKLGLKLRDVLEQKPARQTTVRASPVASSAETAGSGADSSRVENPGAPEPLAAPSPETGEARPPSELARKAAAFDRLVALASVDPMGVKLREDAGTFLVEFTNIVGGDYKRCVREGRALLFAVEATRPLA